MLLASLPSTSSASAVLDASVARRRRTFAHTRAHERESVAAAPSARTPSHKARRDGEMDRDNDYGTRLVGAAAGGDEARLASLLAEGRATNALHPRSLALALAAAAHGGKLGTMRLLLDAGAQVDDGPLLYRAVVSNRLEVARLLLQRGWDAKMEFGYGRTSLHLATEPEMIHLLVEAGADVEATDWAGKTPLVARADCHNATSAGMISQRVDAMSALLDHGADPEATNRATGQTPLIIAAGGHCGCDCVKTVALLVRRGASVDAVDRLGRTALHYCCGARHSRHQPFFTHADTLEVLMEGGADANARIVQAGGGADSKDSWQPLHCLAYSGVGFGSPGFGERRDFFQQLEQQGDDEDGGGQGVDPRDPVWVRMAKLALKLLIQHGADINGLTADGKTPLMVAQEAGDKVIGRELLRLGAAVGPP